jgi:hypothetical protein
MAQSLLWKVQLLRSEVAMRYFMTPGDVCKAVCSHCAETSAGENWSGWAELDPVSQAHTETPLRCDACGAPKEEP